MFIEQHLPKNRLVTAEELRLIEEPSRSTGFPSVSIVYSFIVQEKGNLLEISAQAAFFDARRTELLCMALKMPYKLAILLPERPVFLPVPTWVTSDGYDGIQSILDFPSSHLKEAERFMSQMRRAIEELKTQDWRNTR
jgi:hypothetical protein